MWKKVPKSFHERKRQIPSIAIKIDSTKLSYNKFFSPNWSANIIYKYRLRKDFPKDFPHLLANFLPFPSLRGLMSGTVSIVSLRNLTLSNEVSPADGVCKHFPFSALAQFEPGKKVCRLMPRGHDSVFAFAKIKFASKAKKGFSYFYSFFVNVKWKSGSKFEGREGSDPPCFINIVIKHFSGL